MVAASALTLSVTGCGECLDCGGFGVVLPRNRILALGRADATAPPPGSTVVAVKNSQTRTIHITHSDSTQTTFLDLTFPAGSMVQNGNLLVCDTCTVSVAITPTAGVYGFTLGPPGLVFRSSSTPTVTVSYGKYADFSVRDSSTLYPTQQAFDQALALWYEATPGMWTPTRNSGHSGSAMVSAAIDAPGAHLLAAFK